MLLRRKLVHLTLYSVIALTAICWKEITDEWGPFGVGRWVWFVILRHQTVKDVSQSLFLKTIFLWILNLREELG
jgi:hypothetical protein